MNKIENLKNKINNILINKNTPFVLLIMCLIADALYILLTSISTFYFKATEIAVSEWVEYGFLFFNILFLVTVYKKGDRHLNDALVGEILAVFSVTCISFLVSIFIDIVKTPTTENILYLVIEFICCTQAFLLFLTHVLMEKKKKPIRLLSISLNLILIGLFLVFIFDIYILIKYPNNIAYIVLAVGEIISIIIEVLLTFVVKSIESIKVEMNRIKKLKELEESNIATN